jgi:hypothetical protein
MMKSRTWLQARVLEESGRLPLASAALDQHLREDQRFSGGGRALRIDQVEHAHLRAGSLEVEAGMPVTAKAVIGAVGSSGNSSEPHLHIHTVRGEVVDADALLFTAEPVPMRFDGRILKRNDVFIVEEDR